MVQNSNFPRTDDGSDALTRELSSRSARAYDSLANEYYSAERHPTCANFHAIHEAILPSFKPLTVSSGLYLEVGCGMGRLDRLVGTERSILTELSESMLAIARKRTRNRARCELMDAFSPDFRDQELKGVFAFLADPYNHPRFFREAYRILARGGNLVVTVPSHRWAVAARIHFGMSLDETVFIHCGESVVAPSITRPLVESCEMLQRIGFHVRSAYSETLKAYPLVTPSHHVLAAAALLGEDPRALDLIDVIVAGKPL